MGKLQKIQRPAVRERLLDAADPARMGGALLALFDGAIAAAEQDRPQRARDAKWAAQRLLAH